MASNPPLSKLTNFLLYCSQHMALNWILSSSLPVKARVPQRSVMDEPVTFIVNQIDHPDLPGWLRFIQMSEFDDGILYGMPNSEHIGKTTIEAGGSHLLPFSSKITPEHPLRHQAELYISNMNMEDFLKPNIQQLFQKSVRKTWRTPDEALLRIANVTSALERGGRIPLPIHLHRKGVCSLLFMISHGECLHGKCCERHVSFSTEWCRLDFHGLIPTYEFEEQMFNPPSATLEPRNFCSDYALTIGLPLALILLLFLILSYIMCCRRKGLLQLVHHDTIEDASRELRDLSKERNIRPLSTLPMFNVRLNRPAGRLSQSDPVPLIPSEQ
uniref:Sarcoglycan, alpha n=1 Tax=Eptatretus burgeri TaxID=7764 RepID=A0A8C4NP67_EPTBU